MRQLNDVGFRPVSSHCKAFKIGQTSWTQGICTHMVQTRASCPVQCPCHARCAQLTVRAPCRAACHLAALSPSVTIGLCVFFALAFVGVAFVASHRVAVRRRLRISSCCSGEPGDCCSYAGDWCLLLWCLHCALCQVRHARCYLRALSGHTMPVGQMCRSKVGIMGARNKRFPLDDACRGHECCGCAAILEVKDTACSGACTAFCAQEPVPRSAWAAFSMAVALLLGPLPSCSQHLVSGA